MNADDIAKYKRVCDKLCMSMRFKEPYLWLKYYFCAMAELTNKGVERPIIAVFWGISRYDLRLWLRFDYVCPKLFAPVCPVLEIVQR